MIRTPTPAKRVKKPNIFLRLLALLTTAGLLLGALALVVYRDRFNLDALRRWMSYRAILTSETGEAAPFPHSGGEKLSIAYLSSGVVTASAAGAHYYSLSGEQYAELVAPMDNPVLSHSRNSAVVYDVGGSTLCLFTGGNMYQNLPMDSGTDLLSARVNDSGWIAVTAQQSGYKGAVSVYDSRQQPVIQISLSSTFVVDAVISPDCRTVAVITMGQDGGNFFSRLLLFPVDQTEPRAQVELTGTTVLDLDYEDGHVWVLGEDQLFIVPEDGSQPAVYPFGHSYIKEACLDGDGFALLLTSHYRSVSATHATLVNSSGQAVQTIELASQLLDFDCAGGYCALLTASRADIYDSQLRLYASLEHMQGTRYLSLSSDGSAILSTGQQARLVIP